MFKPWVSIDDMVKQEWGGKSELAWTFSIVEIIVIQLHLQWNLLKTVQKRLKIKGLQLQLQWNLYKLKTYCLRKIWTTFIYTGVQLNKVLIWIFRSSKSILTGLIGCIWSDTNWNIFISSYCLKNIFVPFRDDDNSSKSHVQNCHTLQAHQYANVIRNCWTYGDV